jgi:dimethylargininase
LIFKGAVVRAVPETISAGITSANLGKADYERAREQHDRYVGALEECGLEVIGLDADERYPDSVFIEDTAVVTDRCAIIANPGAASRRGEVGEVEDVLAWLYEDVKRIVNPGTLDGGDVLQVGEHFYIGLTRRTNREGAELLCTHLQAYGFNASTVELRRFLHLKTGVAYLGGNDLVVAGELAARRIRGLRQDLRDPGRGVLRQLHQGQRSRPRSRGVREHEGEDRREGIRGHRVGDVRVPEAGRGTELSLPAIARDRLG